MKMTIEEVEQLRQQAIEAEEERVEKIRTFLDDLDLTTSINKVIALELATAIAFVERDIERLKQLEEPSEHELVWQNFWKKTCAPAGRMDEEQIKKELYDYKLLLDEVPTVYDELAGFSKPHTSARVIIDAVNERMIDKQNAFDDLTMTTENGEVTLSVERLKEYFDIR